MSASVRISAKSARALVGIRTIDDLWDPDERRAMQELSAALSKVTRQSEKKRPTVKAKAAKKKSKGAETKDIRAALLVRAGGQCELCGGEGREMHHALSRRVPQDIANVLFVCRMCHRDITNSRPSAVDVLQAQASKFGQLGHNRTARALLARRDFVLARGAP